MFDLSDFRMLHRIVQDEPVREHDKAMYGMLATIGIERGKEFEPSAEVAAILEEAAKDAQAFAIQAGREVRVIVDPENVDDAACHQIARDIARRVSEEMTFPGEIRVTVLREMRTVEYAR